MAIDWHKQLGPAPEPWWHIGYVLGAVAVALLLGWIASALLYLGVYTLLTLVKIALKIAAWAWT